MYQLGMQCIFLSTGTINNSQLFAHIHLVLKVVHVIERRKSGNMLLQTYSVIHYENFPMQYTEIFKVIKNNIYFVERN